MQGHDLSRAVGEEKKIAPGELPEIGGSVLNGGRMLGGHQRPEIRQIRQQHRGLCQSALTLRLKLLEGHHGIVERFVDLAPRMIPQVVLDDEQDRARQHGGGEDEGEKKLGSQPNLGHGPIAFSAPRRPVPAVLHQWSRSACLRHKLVAGSMDSLEMGRV